MKVENGQMPLQPRTFEVWQQVWENVPKSLFCVINKVSPRRLTHLGMLIIYPI